MKTLHVWLCAALLAAVAGPGSAQAFPLPEFPLSELAPPHLSSGQRNPKVAPIGLNRFLVVWEDQQKDGQWDLYGARVEVKNDRLVRQPVPFLISEATGNKRLGGVAVNGPKAAVVWTRGQAVEMAYLTTLEGEVAVGLPAVLSTDMAGAFPPLVASVTGGFLFVWTQNSAQGIELAVQHNLETRNVLYAAPATAEVMPLDLACGSSHCALAMLKGGGFAMFTLKADGTPLGFVTLPEEYWNAKQGAVAWNATSKTFLVAYHLPSVSFGGGTFYLATLTDSGVPSANAYQVSTSGPVQTLNPWLTSFGDGFQLSWDCAEGGEYVGRVCHLPLQVDGSPSIPDPSMLPSDGASRATAAEGAGETLMVFETSRNDQPNLGALALRSGHAVVTRNYALTSRAVRQTEPRVVFDGSRYLVLWQEEYQTAASIQYDLRLRAVEPASPTQAAPERVVAERLAAPPQAAIAHCGNSVTRVAYVRRLEPASDAAVMVWTTASGVNLGIQQFAHPSVREPAVACAESDPLHVAAIQKSTDGSDELWLAGANSALLAAPSLSAPRLSREPGGVTGLFWLQGLAVKGMRLGGNDQTPLVLNPSPVGQPTALAAAALTAGGHRLGWTETEEGATTLFTLDLETDGGTKVAKGARWRGKGGGLALESGALAVVAHEPTGTQLLVSRLEPDGALQGLRSLGPVVGAPGLATGAAAEAFLLAYSRQRAEGSGTQLFGLVWDHELGAPWTGDLGGRTRPEATVAWTEQGTVTRGARLPFALQVTVEVTERERPLWAELTLQSAEVDQLSGHPSTEGRFLLDPASLGGAAVEGQALVVGEPGAKVGLALRLYADASGGEPLLEVQSGELTVEEHRVTVGCAASAAPPVAALALVLLGLAGFRRRGPGRLRTSAR